MSDSVDLVSGDTWSRGGFMAWLVCLSAGLFFLYEFFQLTIFNVINLPLREDFHLTATQVSWLSSAYLWANVLFLLPAGIILDRYSTRWVILTAMLLCVMGILGFALTHDFYLAACFRALAGIGNAFCFLSCVILVTRWFGPERRAFVMGILVTLAFLGGMLANAPFAYLNTYFGWRNAVLVDAGLGVVLLIWSYAVLRDSPVEEEDFGKAPKSSSRLPGFVQALMNPQTWLAGIYTSFLNLPIMVLCALWGANYLQSTQHITALAAIEIVSLIFIGSIIGCPLMGWLSDYQGRRKPLMIGGALATLASLMPLLLGGHIATSALAVIFFALGFFSSTQVIAYPLVAESNSPAHTGTATAIASVIIMGGGGVAQVLFGGLLEHHAGGLHTAYTAADFQYAIWLFPITAACAFIAVCLTRETGCRRLVSEKKG